MQTAILVAIRESSVAQEADRILRSCVHCGFCNATCPTYQLLGDELDGPRGRIYQIKQLLEGQATSHQTQLHLDRCLTCRNCETTCPSGVQYGNLLEIGRHYLEQQHPRPFWQHWQRQLVLAFILQTGLLRVAIAVAQRCRTLLPTPLRRLLPMHRASATWPTRPHPRKMVLLEGCVQPVLAPTINVAAAHVLDRLGIQLLRITNSACCGAASHHTSAVEQGKDLARNNINAWWPYIEAGAEAIVMTASGCGVHVKDYGHLLRDDPVYADKAKRVAALTRDISEIIADQTDAVLLQHFKARGIKPIAIQTPCTLQHGQRLPEIINTLLRRCGFTLVSHDEPHLCCGSAGTYSLLQRQLSRQLRARKLQHLLANQPALIVTANIGCMTHLAGGTDTPVRHWIEVFATTAGVDLTD
jgi:glycolate oxidase iron-sulfur subunit